MLAARAHNLLTLMFKRIPSGGIHVGMKRVNDGNEA